MLAGLAQPLIRQARFSDAGLTLDREYAARARSQGLHRLARRRSLRGAVDHRVVNRRGGNGRDAVDVGGIRHALEHECGQPLGFAPPPCALMRGRIAEHRVPARGQHQAGGEVDVSTQHREVATRGISDRPAEGRSGRDAHARADAQIAERGLKRDRGVDGPGRVVFMGQRRDAKTGNQRGPLVVHGDLFEPTAVPADDSLGLLGDPLQLLQRIGGDITDPVNVGEDHRRSPKLREPGRLPGVDPREQHVRDVGPHRMLLLDRN